MSSTDTLIERIDALTAAFVQMAKLTGARLTRQEVLDRLRVSRNTLTSYIEHKGFPRPGLDGKWLLSEIVEWESRK